ncbi:hypothetical protein [Nocardioides stalactiti]|uniref:hypothetical protein n=1 Tax=Nocardioides stalactiti TaxID=2755356 RepID=UPI0016035D47|nr:hypothetical protein [Nocardioides stalactiti]
MRVVRAGLTTLVIGSLLATLSACGDDPEPSRGEVRRDVVGTLSPEVPDGPEAAYRAWLAALAAQDAEAACALQAPELTIDLRYQAILVDRAELGDPCAGFEALLWEDPGFASDVVDLEVTQQTEEDALLAVRLRASADPDVTADVTADVTVRMVYHRARWRVFSTESRAGDDEAARWVDAWCLLSPDQSRDEIVALMGPPSGEYTVSDGGEPQLWWAQDPYDFRVYLDPVDGSVLELVGDYDALDADDRAELACPELRR